MKNNKDSIKTQNINYQDLLASLVKSKEIIEREKVYGIYSQSEKLKGKKAKYNFLCETVSNAFPKVFHSPRSTKIVLYQDLAKKPGLSSSMSSGTNA